MEIRRFKVVDGVGMPQESHTDEKRPKLQPGSPSLSRDCDNAVENCATDIEKALVFLTPDNAKSESHEKQNSSVVDSPVLLRLYPKFGVASVCGRRRDMEDAVAIHPRFCRHQQSSAEFHYFGVYDGHGCSHVRATTTTLSSYNNKYA